MSFDKCMVNLSLIGKVPTKELREAAEAYKQSGISGEAAMTRAVEDKLELMEMEERRIIAAVRSAYEERGGKKREPKAAKPKEEKRERTVGEAAKSAAKNTATGFAAAVQGLGELFGANIDPTSKIVPDLDESTYQKAAPLFRAAVASFGEAAADIREVMRAVIKAVLSQFGKETTAKMKPYVVRFIEDYQAGKFEGERDDAADAGNDTERDSQDEQDGQSHIEANLLNAGRAAHRGARKNRQGLADAGRGKKRGAGVSGRDAVDGGAEGDIRLSGNDAGLEDGTAGSEQSRGSGDRGQQGTKFDARADRETDGNAGVRLSLEQKVELQRKAETIPVTPGDIDNIRETLPLLLEGQQDDVLFAEKRFANPEKSPGVLFTNGTGTGKTFTGLGIAKRFARQGKGNGIIIVPNNEIAEDWIKAGKLLDLDIKKLDSTKDNGGKGMAVTTFANFGDNASLIERDWDFVMADEAHYLMASKDGTGTKSLSTLRALTRHPGGFHAYSRMKNKDLHDLLAATEKGDSPRAKHLFEQLRKREETQRPAYEAIATDNQARPKAVFLSATPFAYVKAIDWAEGYLFEFDRAADGARYNSGNGRERFYMQHFGYRMRYNKLTRPDGAVDEGLMARQFNTWLKREGALSGRMLDVEADYDRKFVMVESALGRKIDEGMEFLEEGDGGKFKPLIDPFRKQFDYLTRRFLLEAIKATEAVPIINEHLAKNRKVVIIHDYKKGGAFNPFTMRGISGDHYEWKDNKQIKIDLAELAEEFRARRPDLVNLKFPQQAALDILKDAFPNALIHNGDVPKKQLSANKKLFNAENLDHPVIILQADKGREGISLHDTTGKYQRVEVNIGLPSKPTALIQLEGRIYRVGQVTDAVFRYLNTGTNWERWTFAETIAERADTAEALAMGELARGLKDSIIEAFEDSAEHPVTDEDGKGGKARDRQTAKILTEWDRAKSFYFGQSKKTSKTKAAEGKDYFATPEPVGLKMVQWADIRQGEHVLEPSAGHGAIARWFPHTVNKTVIEPSGELQSRIRLVMEGNTRFVQERFEDFDLVNKYDAIVMNPPFGVGGSDAIPHLAKAYRHLRDGGRIVALLPRGPAADKKLEKFLYGEDAPKDLFMVADINLPSVTFERAGTGVMTHIVVLERQSDLDKAPTSVRERDLSSIDDINELFDKIEQLDMPARPKAETGVDVAIEEAKEPIKPTRKAAEGATGAERFYSTFQFPHTKTGETMFGAAVLNHLPSDVYSAVNKIAKANGGWYSSYASGNAKRGFLFKSEDARKAFMTQAGEIDEVAAGHDVQNSVAEVGQPIFFSALERAIPDMAKIAGKDGTVKAEQARLWLQSRQKEGKFKAEELAWSGLDDWLKMQTGRVAVADIEAFVRDNGVQVEEVQKGVRPEDALNADEIIRLQELRDAFRNRELTGDEVRELRALKERDAREENSGNTPTKYGQYTLPGGENYRELLLTLPEVEEGIGERITGLKKRAATFAELRDEFRQEGNEERAASFEAKRIDAEAKAAELSKSYKQRDGNYKSSHWDEKNIVAHIRFNSRTDADGNKVLFIEEVQSDWAQGGKKKGFGGKQEWRVMMGDSTLDYFDTEKEANDYVASRPNLRLSVKQHTIAGLPPAPFVQDTKAWVSLALKRMIRYAAENDFDKIAFVNGQQSADRYDLSRKVNSIMVTRGDVVRYVRIAPAGGPAFNILVNDKGIVTGESGARQFDGKPLDEVLGKEIAEKIMATETEAEFSGLDLQVGGEGMKAFYDKIVPQVANDVLKRLGGGKMGSVYIADEARNRQAAEDDKLLSDLGHYLMPESNYTLRQPSFDITPAMREKALEGLPLFSKAINETRRKLILSAAAAALPGTASANVGKAKPINPAVLTERLAAPIEKILRDGNKSGVTNAEGGKAIKKALNAIALTGPKELRALAAQVAKLMPTEGVLLTVDDTRRVNVHGAVELSPAVHMRLFTAEGRTGLTYETFIHEAMHVAVAARYRTLSVGMNRGNDALPGMSKPQAAAAMEQFNQVWEEFRQATKGEDFGNTTLNLAISQARSNPDEFFVRSLTDPLLQSYMANKRYEGKTLWQRFKDWVKTSLFGFKEEGTAPSWLDAALVASGELAEAMGNDSADWSRMAAASKNQASQRSSMAGNPLDAIVDYLAQYPQRPPSGMDRAQFREFMDGKRAALADLLADIEPHAEGLLVPVRNGGFWGVTREARPDGDEWRVTRFDKEMTPQGHEAHRTAKAALEDVIQWADPERMKEGSAAGFDAMYSKMPDWLKSEPIETQEAARKAGIWMPKIPLKQRLKELRTKAMTEFTQGLFDQFAPLKKLDYTSYVLSRMSKSADAPLEALLMYGKPFLNDAGAVDVNTQGGGLIDLMKELKGEHDRFFGWIAGNRAEQLKSEGRENLFTDTDISALKNLNQGTMPDGSSRADLYQRIHKEFNAFSKAVLDIAQKAGIISGKDRAIWEKDFYVPFYRVMEDEADKAKGPKTVSGLVNQYAFKKLKGGTDTLNDLMHNTLQNWSHLLAASLKNQAAKSSIEAAYIMGIADDVPQAQKDSVFFLEQGKAKHYVIHDPFVFDAVSAIEFAGFNGTAMKLLQKSKHYLTLGVTISPEFKVSNLARDTIAAVGLNPVSANIFKNWKQGWQGTNRKSAQYAKMLSGGALMRFGTFLEGDRAEHVKRLIDEGVKPFTILNTPGKIKDLFADGWDWWQELGDRSENLNRAAIYKQVYEQHIKDGKTEDEAHLMASFAARDSMDFSLQGKYKTVRFLSQLVPFMNARLQGLYKMGREGIAPTGRMIAPALFGPEKVGDRKRAARFGSVVLAVSMASIALMLMYQDDDDWKQREEWDRDAYWWFKVGGIAYRIPKPFEIGALGTIAERGLEMFMAGMDKDSRKLFLSRMKEMVLNTFAMDPTPQLFKPVLELWANENSFTKRPIETPGLEKLSKAERIGTNTSATAQLAGKATAVVGLSPVQIDHLVQGYFGWLGTHLVMTTDFAVRPLMGLPDKPARNFPEDYFVIGRFARSLPEDQSKYVTQFYAHAKEVQEAMADIRHYQAIGIKDKVSELRAKHKDTLMFEDAYTQGQKDLAALNREIKLTQYRNMDADAKREKIDKLTQRRNALAKRIEESRKSRQARSQ